MLTKICNYIALAMLLAIQLFGAYFLFITKNICSKCRRKTITELILKFKMFALMDMSSSSEDEDSLSTLDISLKRKQLRSSITITNMPNNEFQKNFRMNKETFLYILNEITPFLKETYRVTAISKEAKLATTIRFLVTGGYQKGIGNELLASLSQPKVSFVITECLAAMEKSLCPKWIKFNQTAEEEMNSKIQFYTKFGIPGVIGCVDGTHVRIKPPKEDVKHLFYNAKGFYSLNVMLVCDANQIITFVDSRHPGDNDDEFIWTFSAVNEYLNKLYLNGKSNTWLLGDGGYPCLPYLLTPYINPSNEIQTNFNTKLTTARKTIERCIGDLKNRFRCLREERDLQYGEEKVKIMVNVCCALHNICKYYKNECPPIDETEEINNNINDDLESDDTISSVAQSIRDSVASCLL